MPTPSPEQLAFREALKTSATSILLEAVAGSGKTTSIIQNLDVIKGDKALMAFNKKIADELQRRVANLDVMTQVTTKVATAHSFGLSAFRAGGYAKSQVNGGKLNFILKDMLEDSGYTDPRDPIVRSKYHIRNLCSLAKSSGFGLTSTHPLDRFPSIDDFGAWLDLAEHYNLDIELEESGASLETVTRLAQRLLKQSNQRMGLIDFDDMIYLPLLLDLKLKQYSAVIIDEAQDTNKVRRELAFRMLKPTGRLIIVGDPHQAIYGFTGADAAALSNLQARAQAIKLPLSVCWRCDQKIIDHARKWVGHIVSHDTEGRGTVRRLPFGEDFFAELQPKDAILCRLNRPNVSVAIALLRRGKTARIEGRDLGQTLLGHARKAAPDMPPLDELQHALETYGAHQIMLLTQKEKFSQAEFLADELDALSILIDRCLEQGRSQYRDLEALCNELFMDDAHKTSAIVLSSVHKSKGLEWPRVYLLGREDYMPFHRATADWEIEQERNLIYVAITRAEHELVEVTNVQSALDKGLHRSIGHATMSEPAAEEGEKIEAAFLQHSFERSQKQ